MRTSSSCGSRISLSLRIDMRTSQLYWSTFPLCRALKASLTSPKRISSGIRSTQDLAAFQTGIHGRQTKNKYSGNTAVISAAGLAIICDCCGIGRTHSAHQRAQPRRRGHPESVQNPEDPSFPPRTLQRRWGELFSIMFQDPVRCIPTIQCGFAGYSRKLIGGWLLYPGGL